MVWRGFVFMAWDDPVVWMLIIGLGVLLFGSNKIPELARSLGKARREFDAASKGLVDTINSEINTSQPSTQVARSAVPNMTTASPAPPSGEVLSETDPLVLAARNEGIDTRGKTRSQIASELAARVHD
jgi:sec-independent protein translocase protein TatA